MPAGTRFRRAERSRFPAASTVDGPAACGGTEGEQMQTKRVAVVGATGLAGQQFLAALGDHPWFDVTLLAASSRSAGKKYIDAIRAASGAFQWYTPETLPERFRGMTVQNADELDASAVDLIFTAIESEPARELEPRYARTTPVISTASAFRNEEDVPILIPGVN